jgi:HAD superfamily hydrolase (TIGR01509 family)
MKAIIFDLDGTLADTESLKAAALSATVEHFGAVVSPEIYKLVMGESWEVVTDKFFEIGAIQVDLVEFDPIFRRHYSQLIDTSIKKNQMTYNFVHLLKSRGFRLGVVSSAARWMVTQVLDKNELQKAFDIVVSGDEVKNHKPNPEAYLVALEKLGLDGDQAISFEDSQAGFKAARSAGIKVYGLRHEYNENHNFDLCEATIESFGECYDWDLFSAPL